MSFRIKTKILIPCFMITVAVFGFWFFFNLRKTDYSITEKNNSLTQIFKEEKNEKSDFVPMSPTTSIKTKKYENIKHGFSFNYPSDFKVSELEEEDKKTILIVQNLETGEGLQIYIIAYDDSAFVVNKEQILKDVPSIPFSNSVDIIVGNKAKGVAFFSQNEAFGETSEAWFAYGHNFYQATAYRKDVKKLEDIIKSWKFQ